MDIKFGVGTVISGTISQAIEMAKLVEGYGFDSMAYTDDIMHKPGWPLVFAASQHTSRVELGVTVSNPHLQHPAMLAMYTGMLDEMSNGRGFLGIARGHIEYFDMMFKIKPKKPMQALREGIEMCKRLWSGDKTPYEGEIFYASEEAYLKWENMPRADLPVLVGTYSPKTVTMAGGLANRILAYGVWNRQYKELLDQCVAKGADEAGRDPSECVLELEPVFNICEDGTTSKEKCRHDLAWSLPWLSPMVDHVVDKEILDKLKAATAAEDLETAKSLVSDEILDQFCLYGTPDQIIEKIEEKQDTLNMKRLSFDMPFEQQDINNYTNLLGKKVLPHFLAKRGS